jgi:glycosyltransferase involved in cell wall biosynthesis
LIVAYNAEKTIGEVLARIPPTLAKECHVEVLVLDDASQDRTFETSRDVQGEGSVPYPIHVLLNPVNQGYGGNQKIGYRYAIDRGFDCVALLHGDGQYAPECLPGLVRALRDGGVDAVFGSRMLERTGALRGGMPLYKFIGNRILSRFQNWMLGAGLSEFHSGYRVYSVAALRKIPFEFNTNDFHFDTEIIVQLLFANMRIVELPIPTYYGDEICHVNGLRYARDVITAVLRARSQQLGLLYDRRFDCQSAGDASQYQPKLEYLSPHSAAIDAVPEGARVLDLGCAGGYVGAVMRNRRRCRVTGVDRVPLGTGVELDRFILHDLNNGLGAIDLRDYDYVLLLDVIEHLRSPEAFVRELQDRLTLSPRTVVLASTANIGFFVNRLMLLVGQFNYGKRGILDLTHSRLFTFSSFRRLFEQARFHVLEERGIPGPFPLAFGDSWLSRALLAVNAAMIRLSRGMFAYQMFFVVEPLPSLDYLLDRAEQHSAARSEAREMKS